MFTKYDEYELLELFLNEPVEICEKEAGIFLYNQEDIHGFKLSLYMSIVGRHAPFLSNDTLLTSFKKLKKTHSFTRDTR